MVENVIHNEPQKDAALLSWIQQFAPYGVFTLDTSLRVQSWNHWMEIHGARRPDEVIGQDLRTLFPDLGGRKLLSPFERALNGESSILSTSLHRYLLPFASPLPEPGFVHMRQTARIMPLLSEEVICGVVVVIEDVTQREIQAEALRRQHRRDEILSWALAHLLKSEEPRKTVRQLFFKIAEHLDFDTFFLYLQDIEGGALTLDTVGGVPPDSEKNFIHYPFLAAIAEAREIVVLSAIKSNGKPEYALLEEAGVSAAIAIPLLANERILGLLCFGTWSRKSIDAEESDLLSTIAQYLATAIDRENTRLQLEKAKEVMRDHALQLEERVDERTSLLQETISELETFSYTLAHDLKAPVRGMTAFCQMLLEDFAEKIPPDATLIVEKLLRASQRMQALIQDLLAFSRISRENVVLSRVDVESIVDDLLALRAPAVREAITIRTPLHHVRAHKALLQQVLSNLVDNAIKFVSPNTAPKITICTEVVSHGTPSTRSHQLVFSSNELTTLLPDTSPKYIRIWVLDEGIGVPPELHKEIFGIFERGITSNDYEGTGMGLAIVARAMQRMGGTCGVESEAGNGSRFWIELPAEHDDVP